jgi:serpin B
MMLSWCLLGTRFIAQTAPAARGDPANYKFAIELYGRLGKTPGNLFFSPSSISSCLNMAQAGARGTTATQMAQVLGFAQGQTSNAQPFHTDHENGPVELNEANGLWVQAGYSFLPKYLSLLSHDFGAAARQTDFVHDPGGSAGMINQWVADKTKGRIRDVVNPGSFDEYTRMVLANMACWVEGGAIATGRSGGRA